MYLLTASQFLDALRNVMCYKTIYSYGTWGWPATSSNKARTIKARIENQSADRQKVINGASNDTFMFDCSGLIKGVLWGWCGNALRVYGGADYAVNGVPDTNNLLNYCTEVSTDFSTIQPGELLYMSGHVGIYAGDGLVIECSPKWEDGVQYSYLGNIGCTQGHSRMWLKHGKLKWIDYGIIEEKPQYYTIQKGDTLSKIGKKFGIPWKQIAELNGIKFPYLIYTGRRLRIK